MGLSFCIEKKDLDLVSIRSIQLRLIGLDDHTNRRFASPDIGVAINRVSAFGQWNDKIVNLELLVRPISLREL